MRYALVFLLAPALIGQNRASVAGTFGYSNFLDESAQHHVTFGGTARVYFTQRTALEPEVTYMYRSVEDKDLLLQANLTRDLGKATGRAVPYVIGGAGRIWTFNPRFTVSSWSAGGGVGTRIFVTERFFVAPEVRLGTEPIFRLQVSAGWTSRR